MKTYATILAALAMILTVGCSQNDGSAEKAGQAMDQAMEKAGNYTGEKMEEAGNAMERAGEDMKK